MTATMDISLPDLVRKDELEAAKDTLRALNHIEHNPGTASPRCKGERRVT